MSTFIMAVMPWGMVSVGTTMTSLSVSPTHCWAAMMMFLLLGPDAELSVLPGGQPVYYYIVSIE